MGEKFTTKLRKQYFRRLIYKDIEFFDEDDNKPGSINNRLSKDCLKVNVLIGTYLGAIIQGLSSFLIAIIISFIYSWRVTLVSLALSPLMIISGIVETSMYATEDKKSTIDGSQMLSESLNNIKLVKSLNAEETLMERFKRNSRKFQKKMLRNQIIIGVLYGFSQFSMFLVYGIVFYLAAVFRLHYGEDMLSTFVAVFVILFGAYGAGMVN